MKPVLRAIVAAAPAIADQNCGDDLQKLAQRREAALQAIKGHMVSGSLDPNALLPRLG